MQAPTPFMVRKPVFRQGAERPDEFMKHSDYSSKNKSRQTRGFVIAAGICLIAIGVAAWAAYDSVVQEPIDPGVSITETSQTEESALTLSTPTPAPSEKPVAGNVTSTPAPTEKPKATATPKPTATAIEDLTLSFPVGQKVVKRFSADTPVFSETMKDWRVHNGVDFEAKEGEAVKAMAKGSVKEISDDRLLGKVVVITHGDADVWYCGLGDKVAVKKGDSVKAGQDIGVVGSCPGESADGIHLHLEIRRDGKAIDPLPILMKEQEK